MIKVIKYLLVVILTIGLQSCNESSTPKPRGFFRIEFPEKSYVRFDSSYPFSFYYPDYGHIASEPNVDSMCWFNIEFPAYKGKIHLSYFQIYNNLDQLIDDSHKFAYKHSIKADAIKEIILLDNEKKIFGLMYDIAGNAASSLQFYVTDSINHYLRGSLYFNTKPEKDSLAPVIKFFRKDIEYFIETLSWNN